MTFANNKDYKFGILSQTNDGNFDDYNPKFARRPKQPVVISGDELKKWGIDTFHDYLKQNPHGFPTNKIVHCYELRYNGDGSYPEHLPRQQGNPLNQGGNGLNDKFDPRQQTMNMPNASGYNKQAQQTMQEYVDWLKGQLSEKDQEIKDLRNKVEKFRNAVQATETKYSRKKIEYDILKGQYEKLLADYQREANAQSGFEKGFNALADMWSQYKSSGGSLGDLVGKGKQAANNFTGNNQNDKLPDKEVITEEDLEE